MRDGTLGGVKFPEALDATSEPKENTAGLERGKIWGEIGCRGGRFAGE